MADVITQSSVVQIVMVDAGGNKQSFNIDNPKDAISMSQIKAALAPAISSGYWYSRNGEVFTAVNSATVENSQKIKLDNSDTVIEITPASLTLPRESTSTGTVAVEGATLIGAYLTNVTLPAAITSTTSYYATVSGQNATVRFQFSAGLGTDAITATLNVVTDARTVSVPVSIPAAS